MENFETSDEFIKDMIEKTPPPTQEEIDARQPISEEDPVMLGDSVTEKVIAQEDKSAENQTEKE